MFKFYPGTQCWLPGNRLFLVCSPSRQDQEGIGTMEFKIWRLMHLVWVALWFPNALYGQTTAHDFEHLDPLNFTGALSSYDLTEH